MPESQQEIQNSRVSFDIDKALNTTRFFEFLGQFSDSDSLDYSDNSPDTDTVKERYEAFIFKNKVATELKALYRETINRDIGINLPETEFACIDVFLEAQAVENPGSIAEFYQDIQDFKSLPKEIASAEQTLKSLGGLERIQEEIDAIQVKFSEAQTKLSEAQEKYDLEEEKDVDGKWRGRKKRREAKAQRLASIQKEIDGLKSESSLHTEKLAEFTNKQTGFTKAQEAKKEIGEHADALRIKIFEDFVPAKEILEKAKEAAKNQLISIFEKWTNTDNDLKQLKQVEDVQAYFDKITKEDGQWYYADGVDVEGNQRSLDHWITLQFNTEIAKAIESLNPGSSTPLDTLEKKLKSYLEKDRLGSQKGEGVKEFILQTLQEKAEQESSPAKRILLRRIIAKFSARKIA